MSGESAEVTERVQHVGQTAKEQSSATADQTKQAASAVAGTAADQVKAVTGEARQQVGTVVQELRERVTDQAQEQTQRMAGTLRQWADDLGSLAQNAPADSPARSLVTQAAGGSHRAAEYLDKQGPAGLVGDLQGFARRRPGAAGGSDGVQERVLTA
ncbi:hypothetical protein [Streptomyces sp. H39-S7]|uniref:hypothetical protein n=1 Tax=Streptomyces sp. H39-S7 TaxID=3004357 RepID=UPI0022AED4C3|nr:hypothetical protein [Streptomyces sp. H39-S7]MCZ4124204.1 hypothetical protein [Streptomyces sp. H39-S7]